MVSTGSCFREYPRIIKQMTIFSLLSSCYACIIQIEYKFIGTHVVRSNDFDLSFEFAWIVVIFDIEILVSLFACLKMWIIFEVIFWKILYFNAEIYHIVQNRLYITKSVYHTLNIQFGNSIKILSFPLKIYWRMIDVNNGIDKNGTDDSF